MLAVDELAEGRARRRTDYAGDREHCGAGPFDIAGAPVSEQINVSVGGNGKRTGADGYVRVADTNDVEEKRHG